MGQLVKLNTNSMFYLIVSYFRVLFTLDAAGQAAMADNPPFFVFHLAALAANLTLI